MIESRCGVCCNSCDKFKDGSCKGCMNIDQPVWGVCTIQKCCKDKNLDFCGQCPDFPCQPLATMGIEYGFDPQIKLNQCRAWLEELKFK